MSKDFSNSNQKFSESANLLHLDCWNRGKQKPANSLILNNVPMPKEGYVTYSNNEAAWDCWGTGV